MKFSFIFKLLFTAAILFNAYILVWGADDMLTSNPNMDAVVLRSISMLMLLSSGFALGALINTEVHKLYETEFKSKQWAEFFNSDPDDKTSETTGPDVLTQLREQLAGK